ncbi:hypothetical protein LIER_26196 [Lithospermum erythrorhizon]|uniref:DUF4283 domain-containing protein n=1 Tax=Lithospermum erythrorhizon TaxID=34254 RepID=A0AAV3RBH5_LITER
MRNKWRKKRKGDLGGNQTRVSNHVHMSDVAAGAATAMVAHGVLQQLPMQPHQSHVTWAEKVREPKQRVGMKFFPPEIEDGVPVVRFTKMRNFVKKQWARVGDIEVFKLDSGIFIFKFQNDDLRGQVINEGPWTFEHRPLVVQEWRPWMKMDRNCIERLPIWIRFPGLAFEHWDLELLSKIASTVGKPLFPDTSISNTSTMVMDRFSYTRICVEITVESPLPKVVKMKDENGVEVMQEIIYEWVPFQCEKCHLLGQRVEKHVAKMVYKPMEEVGASGASELVKDEQHGHDIEEPAGLELGGGEDPLNLNITEAQREGWLGPSRGQLLPNAGLSLLEYRRDQGLESDAIVSIINTSILFLEISMEILKGLNDALKQQYIARCKYQYDVVCIVENKFMLSVVYATNLKSTRKVMWKELLECGQLVVGKPWILMGDFNVVLDFNEAKGGVGSTLRKLDRVMMNECWEQNFPNTSVLFDSPGLSDHSFLKIHINEEIIQYGCNFKYYSFWRSHPSYDGDDIIAKCWEMNVDGIDLYVLKYKMNLVKNDLQKLNKEYFGNISKRVEDNAKELYSIQKDILQGKGSEENYKEEKKLRKELYMFQHAEENLLKAKSRVKWDPKPKLNQEECEFVSQCIDKRLDSQQQDALCIPVQEEEIRKTLFSMAEHKASGPAWFSVELFKENWNEVGVDFMKAVREFFVTCFMPKTVSLIPKKQCTTTMRDYRPIACCNVL